MSNIAGLLDGFERAGGWINRDIFGLDAFPDMGYGALALQDIPPDTPLFHVPRSMILSHLSSELRQLLTESEWQGLGSGWSPLILTMMWEISRGVQSPWHYYLGRS
jgi:SET domain-containing protein 6